MSSMPVRAITLVVPDNGSEASFLLHACQPAIKLYRQSHSPPQLTQRSSEESDPPDLRGAA
jgi:hypothetical protein